MYCLALASILFQAQPRLLNLTETIRLAESNRPTIKAANLRVNEAISNRKAAGAFPSTRLEVGHESRPALNAGEDLLIAQPVDIFGKVGASRDIAQAGVNQAFANLRQVKLDLQSEVINAYANLVSAQIFLRTGESVATITQASYEATQKRVNIGDQPTVQVLRASLDSQRAKQTLEVRKRSLQAARQRLAASLNVSVDQISAVDEQPIQINPLMSKRPDIQLSQATVEGAKAELKSNRLAGLPDVEFQFRRAPWSEPQQYGGRIQIVWQLIDFGAIFNKTSAARIARQAAEQDLQDRVQRSQKELAAARADLEAAQLSVASFGKLEADANTLVQKEQRGYEIGGNTLLDVLEATRALREIQESAADAALRLLQAQAKVLEAAGIVLTETK